MTALTRRELKQLKQDAAAFARRCEPGRTYYVVETASGIKGGTYLAEIQFKKKAVIGLMYGSLSPEQFWIHHGPVYEDRNHPAIRNLRTWAEQREHEAKFGAEFLASEGHREALAEIARSTGFRSTW